MSFALLLALVTSPSLLVENDYRLARNWLCRPGHPGACASDHRVTRVGADGSLRVEPDLQASKPAADCFYVYPTASLDPTPISDMVANADE